MDFLYLPQFVGDDEYEHQVGRLDSVSVWSDTRSTYLTGSSLIALGLTWWQALISIVVGSLLTTIFIVLNSTAGAFYHIGFPVVNRYVWGMYGSQFVILNRILLSLVWVSISITRSSGTGNTSSVLIIPSTPCKLGLVANVYM